MNDTYAVSLPKDAAKGWAGLEGEFARINVILGANGTGKSKLLDRVRSQPSLFGGNRALAYVEGGRVVEPPASVALRRNNIDEFADLEQATKAHQNKKHNKLKDRVGHLFTLLDRLGEQGKSVHSDAVTQWIELGQQGDPPEREEPPLDRLFRLFAEVFPEIAVSMEPASKNIICIKGGSRYGAGALSDGERQVLALLADLTVLGDDGSLIVVDEPELNLNVHLACRLWDSIEAALPKAVFVYATHALGFAMRGNVERVFILGGQDRPAVQVPDVTRLTSVELREFLGAIPAILAAPAALVVEGEDTSIDSLFYEWVVARPEIVVVPVGDSASVRAAVRRTGVWERLAPTVKLVGVIDRDFKSDEAVAGLASEGVHTLPLHECESYLCDPHVIVDAAHALGVVEQLPTVHELEDRIIENLRENRLGVAARRAFAALGLRSQVALPRQALEAVASEEALKNLAHQAAKTERDKVDLGLSERRVDLVLDGELKRVDEAIAKRDVKEALALTPGKQLLGRLLSVSGVRSPSEFVRAVRKHLKPEAYPLLAALQKDLSGALR